MRKNVQPYMSLLPFHYFTTNVLLDKVIKFLCLILLTCKLMIVVPMCSSYLLLCNKLPQTQQLKIIYIIYYLNFYGSGVQAQLSCVLCFRVSHKAKIKVSARAKSHLKAQLGKGAASNCTWLLAELISLRAVALRSSVSSWLLAEG